MKLQEAISLQRAAKQFLPKKIESAKIDRIVRAGNACEVAVGVNMSITVITRDAVISFIEEKARELWLGSDIAALRKLAANQDNSPVCGAPAVIVLSAPKKDSEILRRLAFVDCACAAQNMMLTATENGLDSCLLNALLQTFHLEEVRQRCEIPVEDECFGILLIGYANGEEQRPLVPIAKNVHYCS